MSASPRVLFNLDTIAFNLDNSMQHVNQTALLVHISFCVKFPLTIIQN